MDPMASTFLTGIGATAVMDLWGLARRRLLGVPVANYAHVGRWLGHMPRGRLRHDAIGRAAPVRHEAAIGWTAQVPFRDVIAGMVAADIARHETGVAEDVRYLKRSASTVLPADTL